MPTYDHAIARTSFDAGADPLVPDPISAEVIQDLPRKCAILQRAKKIQMSVNTQRMPVLNTLPVAYWVQQDTGLKQTTRQIWTGIELVVEELAAIVPIPENYLDDAQVPLWSEIKPRLVEALGAKIDAACWFGTDKPATWGTDIYTLAVAAGNTVIAGTGDDFAQDVSNLGEKIALDGYAVNGFAARPGLSWKLTGMRSADGIPIYQPNLVSGDPTIGKLYGYDVSEVDNGAWDASEAELIAGDFNYAIIGMRSDITWKMFDQGVISDGSGNVVLNLMQQDSVALRVTMRLAFVTANPVNRLQPSASGRSPFGVVQAATAGS
ncbi:MAG TPA: phage major capsid protein [Pedococcus sp.]|nr:phage major capsid protein [Pedococcus sp.]